MLIPRAILSPELIPRAMPEDWTPDEFSQGEADYDGASNVNTTRKRSGKRSREANTAKCRRWRDRHKAKYRERMRLYMRHRRAVQRAAERGEEC